MGGAAFTGSLKSAANAGAQSAFTTITAATRLEILWNGRPFRTPIMDFLTCSRCIGT
jgi:hypothetical protein